MYTRWVKLHELSPFLIDAISKFTLQLWMYDLTPFVAVHIVRLRDTNAFCCCTLAEKRPSRNFLWSEPMILRDVVRDRHNRQLEPRQTPLPFVASLAPPLWCRSPEMQCAERRAHHWSRWTPGRRDKSQVTRRSVGQSLTSLKISTQISCSTMESRDCTLSTVTKVKVAVWILVSVRCAEQASLSTRKSLNETVNQSYLNLIPLLPTCWLRLDKSHLNRERFIRH